MSYELLIGIPFDVYALILAPLVGLLCIVYFIWSRRSERRRRETFLSRFEDAHLRSSPYKIGVVFHVVGQEEGMTRARLLWNDGKPVTQEVIQEFAPDELVPFNRERFLSVH